MTESTNVSLNLQSPNISTVVYAVQNDRSSRHIVAQLFNGSSPWTPPAGALPTIRYLKPDGTCGFYDTDDNDNSAVTITGSVADMTLVEQTLTVAGDVFMQLNFYATDGTRLTTFAWILRVQPSVLSDATIVSSDYFNVLTETIAEGAAIASQLTFPVPIGNGGTGAATAEAAREALGLGKLSLSSVIIPKSSSSGISVANGEIGVLFCSGGTELLQDMILYQVTSGGTVVYTRLNNAQRLSVASSANTITLTNNDTGNACQVRIITL